MESKKKKRKPLLIQLGIALGIAAMVACSQGLSLKSSAQVNFGALCDGCFISAVLFVGLGSLMWIASTGFFDLFSYGVKSLMNFLTPTKKLKDFPDYYEYKCEKDEKREGRAATYSVLLAGLMVFALSVLFLLLYNHFTPAV